MTASSYGKDLLHDSDRSIHLFLIASSISNFKLPIAVKTSSFKRSRSAFVHIIVERSSPWRVGPEEALNCLEWSLIPRKKSMGLTSC